MQMKIPIGMVVRIGMKLKLLWVKKKQEKIILFFGKVHTEKTKELMR